MNPPDKAKVCPTLSSNVWHEMNCKRRWRQCRIIQQKERSIRQIIPITWNYSHQGEPHARDTAEYVQEKEKQNPPCYDETLGLPLHDGMDKEFLLIQCRIRRSSIACNYKADGIRRLKSVLPLISMRFACLTHTGIKKKLPEVPMNWWESQCYT